MKNYKLLVTGAVLAVGTAVAEAVVNTVVLTQNSYSFSVAGEFNANTTQNFLGGYAPSAIVGTGFETFCIESMIDFNPGQTYTYALSANDSRGVPLSQGAAYLYSQFGHGSLANYDYTDTAARNTDASLLQAAIWWFQGNQTYTGYPSPTNNVFYEQAISALGETDAFLPSDGMFGVDVLQLWDGTAAAQNQLVLVPDGGSAAGILGLGLTALAVARRRLKVC